VGALAQAGRMSRERESFIDLLRFAAAASVVVFHFGFRGFAAHSVQDIAYPELAWFAKYGYLGVEVFFMISGYVIPLSIHNRSVAEFVASRAIRLYPTFWLSVALLATVPLLLGDWRFHLPLREILLNLTMLAELFGARYVDPVFWTLATELQFYALVAVAVGLLGFRRLPSALLVWLLIGMCTSAFAKATGTKPVYLGGTYYMYFCFGAGCYFLHHLERGARVYALLGLSLPMMLAHTVHKAGVVEEGYLHAMQPLVACAIVLAGAVAVFCSRAISERLPPGGPIVFIGGLTYPLYLLHENIGYAILNTQFSPETRWLGFFYVTVLCLAASAAVYLWFDLPVRRRLRRSLRKVLQPA
jgi:peptidoglycan/LPS O-acetylase OafA/YrhL